MQWGGCSAALRCAGACYSWRGGSVGLCQDRTVTGVSPSPDTLSTNSIDYCLYGRRLDIVVEWWRCWAAYNLQLRSGGVTIQTKHFNRAWQWEPQGSSHHPDTGLFSGFLL